VLDAKTNAVMATMTLDGKPEFPVSNGRGIIFVNIEDKNIIAAINAKTMSIDHRWPIAPGEEPTGLAIDNDHHRLFSVCHNKLMVILDSDNGKVIATAPIGDRTDGAVYDPGNRRAYSSNGDGTLTVVQENETGGCSVLETVPTQKGARTIAIDTKTHHLFLPAAEYGPAPAPAADNPKPRPAMKPHTFTIFDIETLN
jgi:DNA-binding beta-propeller fold protein YncE